MGVFSVAEARSAGYGPDEIRALRSSGRWVRLRQGVYTTAEDLAVTERDGVRHAVECLAVLTSLARPTAVVSHASAARVWDWPVPRREPGTVRLTDPHQWRRTADYRMACAPVPPEHRAHRGPVPLTSPARTLVDCSREWPLEDAVIAMDAGLLAGQTTSAELRDALALARHWPGAPARSGPSPSPTAEPSHRWRHAADCGASARACRCSSRRSRSGQTAGSSPWSTAGTTTRRSPWSSTGS
ncbi:type IV toxin-antitoxin system AbiEi family antitoxin domain-containing protein [Modestobacter sp. VKM Ac-2982]|nr:MULTISPECIES: type IV toxin-antitoxin system AbiEi family antitoxin domain-containing protein [unclassified Modestobacter]MCZ2823377.1 type IV toxin-antitoxin system AbiEi family antitoxin domain-containing protein [Modestobacter sp. VKM Ac-2981]MCZ2851622.1 type IV toxin-antitoxin system AbiEi family antitoxin domain-containing protein [Modestobacter sp. VKM Ac-2982]